MKICLEKSSYFLILSCAMSSCRIVASTHIFPCGHARNYETVEKVARTLPTFNLSDSRSLTRSHKELVLATSSLMTNHMAVLIPVEVRMITEHSKIFSFTASFMIARIHLDRVVRHFAFAHRVSMSLVRVLWQIVRIIDAVR